MTDAARNVLVTGGSGYLGSLVVDLLARRDEGTVVSLDLRSSRRTDVVEIIGDIRDVDLVAACRDHDVAAIVHLAAVIDPPATMDEATLHAIEVGGTQRVVDAALAAGVGHLTVTSSGAAYGYHASNRGRRLTEDDPIRGHPVFAYARHKAEVERLLAHARRHSPELGQLVLRVATILGVATDNQITRLFSQPVVAGLRGIPVPFSFVWDRDVAEVVATGALAGRTGIFNVAGDGVVTLRDIARIRGRPFVGVPASWLERGLGALDRLGIAPYGPEQVDFLRHRPVLANDRLKLAFPGLPRKSSRETFDTWRRGRARRA